MHDTLEHYLVKHYPQLFTVNGKSTLMNDGIECSDGWFHIINSLCSNIASQIKQDQRTHDNQIKWKAQQEAGQEVPDWVGRDENGIVSLPEDVVIPTVIQVKEKFGMLRFYMNDGTPEIYGMIGVAETLSGVTCEECGCPGKLRSQGWIRTLCDAHAQSMNDKPLILGDSIQFLTDGTVRSGKIIDLEKMVVESPDSSVLGTPTKTVRHYSVQYKEHAMMSYWDGEALNIVL